MSSAQRYREDSNGRKKLPLWRPGVHRRGWSRSLKEEPWTLTRPPRGERWPAGVSEGPQWGWFWEWGKTADSKLLLPPGWTSTASVKMCCWGCGGSGGEVTARTGSKIQKSTSHLLLQSSRLLLVLLRGSTPQGTSSWEPAELKFAESQLWSWEIVSE